MKLISKIFIGGMVLLSLIFFQANANDLEIGMISLRSGNTLQAKKHFKNACKKEVNACVILSQLYLADNTKTGLNSSLVYLNEAYEKNNAWATSVLASIYMNDKFNRYDKNKAIELFEKSCNMGRGEGCVTLGLLLKNESQLFYLRKGCESGHSKGCSIINKLNLYPNKASLEKACENNNFSECLMASDNYYISGNRKYKYYLEKSCTGGNVSACASLGGAYFFGDIKIDNGTVVAKKLLKEACENGSSHGCNLLGAMYEHGRGGELDLNKAKSSYLKSCFLNDESGCVDYVSVIKKLK